MTNRELNQIYNQLTVKDMPRGEFIKRAKACFDDKENARILNEMVARKRHERTEKARIDKGIENGHIS